MSAIPTSDLDVGNVGSKQFIGYCFRHHTWLFADLFFVRTIRRQGHIANMIAKVLAMQIYSPEWFDRVVG
jgi:hypothetical protein